MYLTRFDASIANCVQYAFVKNGAVQKVLRVYGVELRCFSVLLHIHLKCLRR